MIISFVSGVGRSITDFLACSDACYPIGVQVGDISASVLKELPKVNALGSLLFVDSGAFPAFQKGIAVDFEAVFAGYHSLLNVLPRPEIVAVVMPDVVGDMDGTADLQKLWMPQMKEIVATGAEVLVPIQRGWDLDAYLPYLQSLRTEIGAGFTLAFAYNKHAWSDAEMARVVADYQPEKVHLLGIGKSRIGPAAGALWAVSPSVVIAHDSCRVRSLVGKGRPLTIRAHQHVGQKKVAFAQESVKETIDYVGCLTRKQDAEIISDLFDLDDKELLHRIYNVPGFLTRERAAILANFMGIPSAILHYITSFVDASQRAAPANSRFCCALGDFIEFIAGDDLISVVRLQVERALHDNRKVITSSSRRLALSEILTVEKRQAVQNVQLQMLF